MTELKYDIKQLCTDEKKEKLAEAQKLTDDFKRAITDGDIEYVISSLNSGILNQLVYPIDNYYDITEELLQDAQDDIASILNTRHIKNIELIQAIEKNEEERAIELIKDKDVDVSCPDIDDSLERTAFEMATNKFDEETINLNILNALFKYKKHWIPESSISQALIDSAWNNNLEVMQILIDEGADVNYFDDGVHTPLVAAARHEEAFSFLLKNGANPHVIDTESGESLYPKDMIKTVYAHETDYDVMVKKITFLIEKNSYQRKMKELGTNHEMNEVTKDLYIAVESMYLEKVKECLDNGADVNAKHEYNETPLWAAVGRRNSDITKVLIENGADVNAKRKGHGYPIHEACNNLRSKNIKLLIEAGVDLNVQDDYHKDTPLHKVIKTATTSQNELKLEIVKMLLKAGAKIDLEDKDGRTPYLLSKIKHFDEGLQLFKELGIKDSTFVIVYDPLDGAEKLFVDEKDVPDAIHGEPVKIVGKGVLKLADISLANFSSDPIGYFVDENKKYYFVWDQPTDDMGAHFVVRQVDKEEMELINSLEGFI